MAKLLEDVADLRYCIRFVEQRRRLSLRTKAAFVQDARAVVDLEKGREVWSLLRMNKESNTAHISKAEMDGVSCFLPRIVL